jgi:hypothetical protein
LRTLRVAGGKMGRLWRDFGVKRATARRAAKAVLDIAGAHCDAVQAAFIDGRAGLAGFRRRFVQGARRSKKQRRRSYLLPA